MNGTSSWKSAGIEVNLLLSEGRLNHLPLAERVIKEAFENEGKFRDSPKEVYKNNVARQFRKLAAN